MAVIKHNIFEINPDSFSNLDTLSPEEATLIAPVETLSTFIPNDNFIELSYFSLDNERILTVENYTNYSVLTGDRINGEEGTKEIAIDVLQDFKQYNPETSEVVALYNFLDYPYSDSNTPENFYIESISPDRTEVRLISTELPPEKVLKYTEELQEKRSNTPYALELFIYKGENTFYPAINLDIEVFRNTYGVLLKLINPLPVGTTINDRVNIVEKVSEPVAYRVVTTITEEEERIPQLRGANYDIELETETTEPTEYYNYNELFSFPTNNSNRELNSMFSEKGAELSIDYTEYVNFINFSSAEERLLNFKYKLDLIESYQTNLDTVNNTSTVYNNTGVSGSREYFTTLIKGVVDNLDHYERHLYYESGSSSWPKSNNSKPYINYLSSTSPGLTWYNTNREAAILYDAQNADILTNTIPAYLTEDSNNEPYNLFVHMVAQHFDNIWIYTDAVSKKYNADNRLNKGVSKDLVEDLLKNFGIKLYTSNRSAADLYRYFTANTYNIEEEYLPSGIITTPGENSISQNDYQKEIYKRIYHNLPLLIKSKGTEQGLRALINCFGIPSDVLKIKVFGGQSVKDLPFYGGQQAFTSSLDKIRLDNTSSIASGDTVSYYTSINKLPNDTTQDLHRIEIGFSPADNIDSYIVSQSAVLFPNNPFNIDNYIGDPRDISTNRYQALQDYANTILQDVSRYELEDFVRLIKFFDNVLFKMVRDFVPARTVTDTGIIVKSHILERSKHTSPVMSWTQPEYSGSIDTAFITGSNGGAYASVAVNSQQDQSQTKTNHRVQTPVGSLYRNDKLHEEPRLNGELKDSKIVVTRGELNESNPFKNLEYDEVEYKVRFYKVPPDTFCDLTSPGTEVIYNPLIGNPGQGTNVNLFGLFSSDYTTYNFNVTSSGVADADVGNPYDFTNDHYTGSYDAQYKTFTVGAVGTDDDECIAARPVKLVYCSMAEVENNTPVELSSLNTGSDLTTWWQSTETVTFPHDPNSVEYGITQFNQAEVIYTPAQAANFDFSTFTTEGLTAFRIYDTENPTGTDCYIEFNINYQQCLLFAPSPPSPTTRNTENVPGGYTEYFTPYGFTGTSGNETYSFRLFWNDPDTTTGANNSLLISDWVEVTGSAVPTGTLEYITSAPYAEYTAANTCINTLPPASPYDTVNTFTEFQVAYASNNAGNLPQLHIQFKATEANCEAIWSNTGIQLNENTDPIVYNQVTLAFSATQASACCPGSNIGTYWSQSPQSDFNNDMTNIYPICQVDPNTVGGVCANNITPVPGQIFPLNPGYYKSPTVFSYEGYARYWDNGWGSTTYPNWNDCSIEFPVPGGIPHPWEQICD
tara:strand:+ start:569 stop:4546 length:3978 start_codon:yes stop_codon:yes gene_type:complete